jgi:hypothetical protein
VCISEAITTNMLQSVTKTNAKCGTSMFSFEDCMLLSNKFQNKSGEVGKIIQIRK